MDAEHLQALLAPAAYPEPTTGVRLIQTHVSYIFITDSFVYKIKKPVDFGFLNFSTLDRRRFYCNEEVRLNRRLSPDIYLGVVEVRESADGVAFDADGNVIDYAVKMRRLPADRMLDRVLAEGALTDGDVRAIAGTIGRFHLDADRTPEIAAFGGTDMLLRNWEENFQQATPFVGDTVDRCDLDLIRTWVAATVAEKADLFAARQAEGFIRDCDGDLHMENICLAERIYIFDCIEFNDRFRFIDTAADLAFLLMDLEYHGELRYAKLLLDEYLAVTGDRSAAGVLDFYLVYRAFIRGKVESFRLRDPQVPEPERREARERAARYFRLARGYVLRRRLPPTLIITCGAMGSGKSTVADALAFELGLDLLSSDRVRKELAGVPATLHRQEGYGEGLYSAKASEATYAELLARAEQVLAGGRSLIVDATFRHSDERDRFRRLAADRQVSFAVIATICPEELARERLEARQTEPGTVSDGRWELYHRQMADFEPLAATERGTVISCDTTRPLAAVTNDILSAMGLRSCGND